MRPMAARTPLSRSGRRKPLRLLFCVCPRSLEAPTRMRPLAVSARAAAGPPAYSRVALSDLAPYTTACSKRRTVYYI